MHAPCIGLEHFTEEIAPIDHKRIKHHPFLKSIHSYNLERAFIPITLVSDLDFPQHVRSSRRSDLTSTLLCRRVHQKRPKLLPLPYRTKPLAPASPIRMSYFSHIASSFPRVEYHHIFGFVSINQDLLVSTPAYRLVSIPSGSIRLRSGG